MISINKNIQSEILITTMEELVPEDSLFRKVDKYIDFTFIYEEVKDLYCEDNGRPSIDPVVLFKLVFIQALDGIKSMRQTCKKIKVDAEYRWFLGIPFGVDTPHFSTFSKNYERRFKDSDIFEKIFINIVNQAIKYKLVDGKILYTDKEGNESVVSVYGETMVSGFNNQVVGTRSMIITYQGCTLTYEYTIKPYDVLLNRLYYVHQEENNVDYIYMCWTTATTAYAYGTNDAPQQMSVNTLVTLGTPANFTKSIVNNQTVYTYSHVEQYSGNTFYIVEEVTVINNSTIEYKNYRNSELDASWTLVLF